MKIIFTSDNYLELLKGSTKCLNKYWANQEFTVIGFKRPYFELPPNFSFISAGKQEDFGRRFCEPMKSVLEEIGDETLTIFLDDLFLIDYVDQEIYDKAFKKVDEKEVQRVTLFWGAADQFKASTRYDDTFNIFPQNMDNRNSVGPCIINKEYFLSFFRDDYTIWQLETRNRRKAKNNEAKLLVARERPIAPWMGIARKGRYDQSVLTKSHNNEHWNEYQNRINPEEVKLISKFSRWRAGRKINI